MLAASSVFGAFAETHTLDINTRKAGAAVSPTMYGIFFEDINYAADGGLYGELVKNRSFEFPQALLGWQAFGNVEVKADGPFERCPHYVVLGFTGHKECATGLQNEGYFGIGFVKDEPYRFTVWARALDGDATIDVSLADQSTQDETQERAKAQIKVSGSEWKKYEAVLTPGKTAQKGCLRVLLSGTRSVALEHVSLFPVNTFKNRENGMRRDLAQALYDMHPGVLRFPGGCIVEGESLKHRYQWKNTIGPVENRPLNNNRWQSTFHYRLFPDYYQSYGLGFFEYFQLAAARAQRGHGVPVSELGQPEGSCARRLAAAVHTGLSRPHRVCQRRHLHHMGQKACRDGPPGAVQSEVSGCGQRAVEHPLLRASAPVRESHTRQVS